MESLNKSIMCIEMASVPGRGHFLYLALNNWGLPKPEVDALARTSRRSSTGFFRRRPTSLTRLAPCRCRRGLCPPIFGSPDGAGSYKTTG